MFKVLLKSSLDEPYEVSGLSVLIGKHHPENPDMDLYRPLVLRPGQSYLWQTDDPNHDFAPYEKIVFKSTFAKIPFKGDAKRKLVEVVQIETKKRKDWDSKYCPYRNHRYVCLFSNLTESIWSFFGEYIGKIEIRPGIPKRVPISPLNVHLSPWKEVEIRYHRRVDSITGQLFPRAAKWFGIRKRSEKELKELQKDFEATLQKHRLTPDVIRPEFAIDSNLMKEKKPLLGAK